VAIEEDVEGLTGDPRRERGVRRPPGGFVHLEHERREVGHDFLHRGRVPEPVAVDDAVDRLHEETLEVEPPQVSPAGEPAPFQRVPEEGRRRTDGLEERERA